MILIANSCVGGYIYKNEMQQPYMSPFIWSLVDFESMLWLLKNFYTINFKRIKMFDIGSNESNNWEFGLIIDGHVKVKYIHYKFSSNAVEPVIKNVDVYYCRIWEYIIDKYLERIQRMKTCGGKPLFIFANWFDTPETKLTYEQLSVLDALHREDIICAPDVIYSEFRYIKQTSRETNKRLYNTGLAKKIYAEFM